MYNLHTKKQEAYYKKAIRLHEEKGYSTREISKVLPVSRITIIRWLAIFAENNNPKTDQMKSSEHTYEQSQDQSVSTNSPDDDISSLKQQITELKSQLEHESMRSAFLDEMINVAEAKFNIQIRKKAGAKQ